MADTADNVGKHELLVPVDNVTHKLQRPKMRLDLTTTTPPESGSEQPKLSDSNSSSDEVIGSDSSDSSDNNENENDLNEDADADEDQINDVLGVSISQVQTRMKARQTPAEEKSRAIENSGGYFNAVPVASISTPTSASASAQAQAQQDESRILFEEPEQMSPTGLRPEEKDEEKKRIDRSAPKSNRNSFTRSMLFSSLSGRRRALSGDSGYGINLRKLLADFSLVPSRQSTKSILSGESTLHSRSSSTPKGERQRLSDGESEVATASSSTLHSPREDRLAALGALSNARTHSYRNYPGVKKRPPLTVRPSLSDESLYVRSLSEVSTLEHRPHYENVHSMVNSRYKAIIDSLQDSSSRIFSLPNFNLPDFRHEWHPGRFLGDYRKDGGSALEESEPGGLNFNDNISGDPNTSGLSGNNRFGLKSNSIYPLLDHAACQITGDVVVMGGYRGSVLRSAKPPHRQLWVPMKVGLNIRKVDLEVGLSREDEERMEETIIAREVLSHIGPVDICRRLLQRLSKFEKARGGAIHVWDYGYDWRLSPDLLSKRLIQFLERLPCNAPDVPPQKRGAYVIAHSLGGLIARHAVNQRPELFAGVVYAGTPQHCVNILGPLRNGDEVLLSSKVLTAQVNFTIRTSYALLPDDGRCFINKETKEDYLVDFFDVNTWDKYALSPCVSTPLPPAGADFNNTNSNGNNGAGNNNSNNKKGLIDNINLPRIGLAKKRLSARLGKPNSSHAHGPRAHREKEQHDYVPGGSENEDISIHQKNETGTAGGILGPRTAKMPPPDTQTTRSTTSQSSIPSNMNTISHQANIPATATASTIPREKALAYLDRTLKEVKKFRQELAFNESHQQNNRYPPFAVLYSKSLPTVYGARVASREDIKRTDAYDDLAFAAGDGVCLASAAMLPTGYRVIKHGLVKNDRSHVGLLGDLEGVGQCLLALIRGREAGVGVHEKSI